MAVAFDANLGATDFNNATTTGTLTTTAAAAANTWLVVLVSYWRSAAQTLNSISAAGNACTAGVQFRAANGLDSFEIWYRNLGAGGLANTSAITLTFSASPGGAVLAGAMSFTGVTAIGNTATATTAVATTAWSSGSATNTVADSVFVGGAGSESATTSVGGAMTSGTKVHDRWRAGDAQGIQTGYLLAAASAANSVAGAFAVNSNPTTGALLILSGTAGGGGTTVHSLSALGAGA